MSQHVWNIEPKALDESPIFVYTDLQCVTRSGRLDLCVEKALHWSNLPKSELGDAFVSL